MIIKLNPLDTMIFRTPAPFNAGEDYIANSIFPPYPHTYAGIVSENGKLTSGGKPNPWQYKIGLSGIMLDNNPLFKQPLDIVRRETTAQQEGEAYYKLIEKTPVSNYPLEYVTKECESWEDISRYLDYYISLNDLKNYLNAKSISNQCYRLDNLYKNETHTGIEIDKETKAIVPTKMYKRNMIRLCHSNIQGETALFFQMSGVEINDNITVKIGGRNKVAALSKLDKDISISVEYNSSIYFKLYLATPAIFKKGWIPKWISLNKQGFYDGVFTRKGRRIKVKLLCACVGNYLPIGGFGIENSAKPRKMNYAVPSGSVYYFKLLEGKMEDVIRLFHQKCISDYRTGKGFDYEIRDRYRYCDRGYGYAFVGNLTDEQITYLNGRDQ